MAENTVDSTINSLIADDDIPLGNHSPLLVPPALGQSFLQPKFMYPLGAVSLLNPDNFDFERGGDLLNESFNSSPFFDNPTQPIDSGSTSQGISQPNLQAKALIQRSNLQSTRSSNISNFDNNLPKSDHKTINFDNNSPQIQKESSDNFFIDNSYGQPPENTIDESYSSFIENKIAINDLSQNDQRTIDVSINSFLPDPNPVETIQKSSQGTRIKQDSLESSIQKQFDPNIDKTVLSTNKNINNALDQSEQLKSVQSLSQNSLDNKSTNIKVQPDLDSTNDNLQRNIITPDIVVSSNTEVSNVISQPSSLNTNDVHTNSLNNLTNNPIQRSQNISIEKLENQFVERKDDSSIELNNIESDRPSNMQRAIDNTANDWNTTNKVPSILEDTLDSDTYQDLQTPQNTDISNLQRSLNTDNKSNDLSLNDLAENINPIDNKDLGIVQAKTETSASISQHYNIQETNNQETLNNFEVSNSTLDNNESINIQAQSNLDFTDNKLQGNTIISDVLVSSNTEISNVMSQSPSFNIDDIDINSLNNLTNNPIQTSQDLSTVKLENLPVDRKNNAYIELNNIETDRLLDVQRAIDNNDNNRGTANNLSSISNEYSNQSYNSSDPEGTLNNNTFEDLLALQNENTQNTQRSLSIDNENNDLSTNYLVQDIKSIKNQDLGIVQTKTESVDNISQNHNNQKDVNQEILNDFEISSSAIDDKFTSIQAKFDIDFTDNNLQKNVITTDVVAKITKASNVIDESLSLQSLDIQKQVDLKSKNYTILQDSNIQRGFNTSSQETINDSLFKLDDISTLSNEVIQSDRFNNQVQKQAHSFTTDSPPIPSENLLNTTSVTNNRDDSPFVDVSTNIKTHEIQRDIYVNRYKNDTNDIGINSLDNLISNPIQGSQDLSTAKSENQAVNRKDNSPIDLVSNIESDRSSDVQRVIDNTANDENITDDLSSILEINTPQDLQASQNPVVQNIQRSLNVDNKKNNLSIDDLEQDINPIKNQDLEIVQTKDDINNSDDQQLENTINEGYSSFLENKVAINNSSQDNQKIIDIPISNSLVDHSPIETIQKSSNGSFEDFSLRQDNLESSTKKQFDESIDKTLFSIDQNIGDSTDINLQRNVMTTDVVVSNNTEISNVISQSPLLNINDIDTNPLKNITSNLIQRSQDLSTAKSKNQFVDRKDDSSIDLVNNMESDRHLDVQKSIDNTANDGNTTNNLSSILENNLHSNILEDLQASQSANAQNLQRDLSIENKKNDLSKNDLAQDIKSIKNQDLSTVQAKAETVDNIPQNYNNQEAINQELLNDFEVSSSVIDNGKSTTLNNNVAQSYHSNNQVHNQVQSQTDSFTIDSFAILSEDLSNKESVNNNNDNNTSQPVDVSTNINPLKNLINNQIQRSQNLSTAELENQSENRENYSSKELVNNIESDRPSHVQSAISNIKDLQVSQNANIQNLQRNLSTDNKKNNISPNNLTQDIRSIKNQDSVIFQDKSITADNVSQNYNNQETTNQKRLNDFEPINPDIDNRKSTNIQAQFDLKSQDFSDESLLDNNLQTEQSLDIQKQVDLESDTSTIFQDFNIQRDFNASPQKSLSDSLSKSVSTLNNTVIQSDRSNNQFQSQIDSFTIDSFAISSEDLSNTDSVTNSNDNVDVSTNTKTPEIQRDINVNSYVTDINDVAINSLNNLINNQIQRSQDMSTAELENQAVDRKNDSFIELVNNIESDRSSDMQREIDNTRDLQVSQNVDVQNLQRNLSLENEDISNQEIPNLSNISSSHSALSKDINLPELNNNQTVLQMMSDNNAATDLRLPQVLQNLGQTEYLGTFSALRDSQTVSNIPSQFLSAKKDGFNAAISINNIEPTSTRIQSKYDQPNQINSDIQENNYSGWSNIAELLSNLPPPKISSNTSANPLNQKSDNSSDRSYLANSSTNTYSQASSQASSQAIIQRSPDHSYQSSGSNNNDLDLYITPKGLQRDNPNQKSNNLSNIIQRTITSQQEASDLPEVQVTVNSFEDSDDIRESENFEENLTALAQEIYVLLRQRLEIEKERQGSRYQGRLPW